MFNSAKDKVVAEIIKKMMMNTPNFGELGNGGSRWEMTNQTDNMLVFRSQIQPTFAQSMAWSMAYTIQATPFAELSMTFTEDGQRTTVYGTANLIVENAYNMGREIRKPWQNENAMGEFKQMLNTIRAEMRAE